MPCALCCRKGCASGATLLLRALIAPASSDDIEVLAERAEEIRLSLHHRARGMPHHVILVTATCNQSQRNSHPVCREKICSGCSIGWGKQTNDPAGCADRFRMDTLALSGLAGSCCSSQRSAETPRFFWRIPLICGDGPVGSVRLSGGLSCRT